MLTPLRLNITLACPECFFDVKPIIVDSFRTENSMLLQCPNCEKEWEMRDDLIKTEGSVQ